MKRGTKTETYSLMFKIHQKPLMFVCGDAHQFEVDADHTFVDMQDNVLLI